MKRKLKFKNDWKGILGIVLGLVLIIGAIVGITTIAKSDKTTEVKASAFSVGGLNASGKFKDTEASIYTKDAIECLGLDIVPSFESTITFQVYFYDTNGDYLCCSNVTDTKFNEVPTLARYCRIVITPVGDTEVKWYEVNKYAKQLTISVDKTQEFKYLPENNIYSLYKTGYTWNETNTAYVESAGSFATNRMNILNATKVVIKIANGGSSSLSGFFANGTTVVENIEFEVTERLNNYVVYVISVPENATSIALSGNGAYANEIQVYAV